MSRNPKKAFSVIEVVLVLAVAGLIIIAMFVAIPALYRSQRNTVRKNQMLSLMKAVRSYQKNHSGKAPIYFVNNGIVADCANIVKAGGSKSCFEVDESFVTDYVDENIQFKDHSTPKDGNGIEFNYLCTTGSCPDFTDPDGTLYTLKAEGLLYSRGTEYLNTFDHVIHISAFTRCSSEIPDNDLANGIVTQTDDPDDVAIVFRLEGTQGVYCVDNQ